jgi:hypothetical protein
MKGVQVHSRSTWHKPVALLESHTSTSNPCSYLSGLSACKRGLFLLGLCPDVTSRCLSTLWRARVKAMALIGSDARSIDGFEDSGKSRFRLYCSVGGVFVSGGETSSGVWVCRVEESVAVGTSWQLLVSCAPSAMTAVAWPMGRKISNFH